MTALSVGAIILAGGIARACSLPTAELVEIVAVPDARTLETADGRSLRPVGVESFSALGAGPDADRMLQEAMRHFIERPGFRIEVLSKSPDRWGRQPALVADAAGGLLQSRLAAAGVAIAVPDDMDVPCFEEIVAAESAARVRGVGGWAGRSLPAARPDALAPYVDHFAIFEGRVISVGNREWRTYLNFGRRWSEDVTVTIEAKDRELFGGEAGLASLAGREVRVRGHLSERDGPTTVIHSPHQLELIDGGPAPVRSMP